MHVADNINDNISILIFSNTHWFIPKIKDCIRNNSSKDVGEVEKDDKGVVLLMRGNPSNWLNI